MSYEWLNNPSVYVQDAQKTNPNNTIAPRLEYNNSNGGHIQPQYTEQKFYGFQQPTGNQPPSLPPRTPLSFNNLSSPNKIQANYTGNVLPVQFQPSYEHRDTPPPPQSMNTGQSVFNAQLGAPSGASANMHNVSIDQSNSGFANPQQTNQVKNSLKLLNLNNPFRNTNNAENSKVNSISQNSNSSNNNNNNNNNQGMSIGLTKSGFFQSQSQPNLNSINNGSLQSNDLPLSLSSYQLSLEESKTYLRWYNYISTKNKFKDYITLAEVFKFLQTNFKLTNNTKEIVTKMFLKIKERISVDNFYALLRLISVLLAKGKIPTKEMLLVAAPVLTPRSILSKDEKQEIYEEVEDSQTDEPFDFDNFTSLLLTGKSHRVKRVIKRADNRPPKYVRFSQKLETFQDEHAPEVDTGIQEPSNTDADSSHAVPLDFSLPMDQLLERLQKSKQVESQEEKDELADMQESLTHFQNLPKIDSVSLHLPKMELQNAPSLEPLKPTATGSANYLFTQQRLRPTATGSANHLFGFGNPEHNTGELEPLKPTATGSANHLFAQQRTKFNVGDGSDNSPIPTTFGNTNTSILQPTATGSANFFLKQSNGYSQPNVPSFGNMLQPNATGNKATESVFFNSTDPASTTNVNANNNQASPFGNASFATLGNNNSSNLKPDAPFAATAAQPSNPNDKVSDYFNMLLHNNEGNGEHGKLPNSSMFSNQSAQQAATFQPNTSYYQHQQLLQQPQQQQQQQHQTNYQFANQSTPNIPQQHQQSYYSNQQLNNNFLSPNPTSQGSNRPRSNSSSILGDYSSFHHQMDGMQNNMYGRN